jgi:hypothetical protein
VSIPHIPPIDAELALAEVAARRDQVIRGNLVPTWYWSAISVLMVLFVAGIESERPWLIALTSITYALGIATVVGLVALRVKAKVRPELLGLRGAAAIAGFTLALVLLGNALGFTLDAIDVPFPATIACAAVGAGLVAGGPRLMAYLHRLMLSRPQ